MSKNRREQDFLLDILDLFTHAHEQRTKSEAPLAALDAWRFLRARRTLDGTAA